MIVAGALVLILLIGVTASSIIMFWWAAESGQFSNPEAGAKSIFDTSEPIGKTTDRFPPSQS